jgi:hypothetical protein
MRDTVGTLRQVQFREKFEHFLISDAAITAPTAYNIIKDDDNIKLFTNGFQDFKLLFRCTGENIPTFDIDVYYKRGGVGREAVIGSYSTVSVPEITKDVGWVAVELGLNSANLQISEYIELVFSLPAPAVASYTANMMLLKLNTLDYAFGANSSGADSSSSGLDGVYSVANGDFIVSTTASSRVATISGLPFSPLSENNILYAYYRNTSGEKVNIPTSSLTVSASGLNWTVEFNDLSSTFDGTEDVEIYIAGDIRGYDSINKSYLSLK